MIQTEQLSPDTIIFHVQGPFHRSTAKELGLSVFRSHHLGFTNFLFDLSRVPLIDEQGSRHLALIGQGLQDKGGTWKILGNPPLLENQLLSHATFENPPRETWN
jgi:anti-anti-sigma regulatory factor